MKSFDSAARGYAQDRLHGIRERKRKGSWILLRAIWATKLVRECLKE